MNNGENRLKNKEFRKGIVIDLIAYLLAFGIASIPFIFIDGIILSAAAFTATATLVLFIFSVIYSDVSIYDPYWSVAPPVIVISVMAKYGLWNINAVILLGIIGIWSYRLTSNWLYTYKGIGHEDWRYAMYRKNCNPLVFQLISFTGLHFVPTIVVFLGLISALMSIQKTSFAFLSVLGIAIMLGAVFLEYVSDRTIHNFLTEHRGENRTCNISVWKYSRHPNYLGEMLFWTGLYVYFFFLCPEIWYIGLGFLTIIALFLVVSIPMMEKHNEERRIDYAEYKAKTSVLLILPNKNSEETSESED